MSKIPIVGRTFALSIFMAALPMTGTAGQTGAVDMADSPRNPLSEAEAVRLTMARPAVTMLIEGNLALATSGLTTASLWSNPELLYSHETVDRDLREDTEDSLWLTQKFQISGARGLNKDAARERISAAELGGKADRLVMEADTRQLFHQLLHQHRLVQAIEYWAGRIKGIEAVVRKRQEAGEVSRYDSLRLARERALVDTALAREKSRRSRSWAAMTALINYPGVASRFDGIEGELLPGQPPSLEILTESLADRPDIVQLEREASAFDLERRASSRGWVPELMLGVGHKRVDDDLGRDTGPMVTAGITLPLFDRGQAGQQKYSAEAEIMRSQHQLLLQKAHGEVNGVWQELSGLRSAAIEAHRGSDEESAQMIQIAEAAYECGELCVLEILDAYRSDNLAKIQAQELSASARESYIELDLLTGGAVK